MPPGPQPHQVLDSFSDSRLDHQILSVPSPLTRRPQMDLYTGLFGTPIFHIEVTDYSKYYHVFEHGKLDMNPTQELIHFAEKVAAIDNANAIPETLDLKSTAAILDAAGEFGLASGKIFIFNPRPDEYSSDWGGAMLSGFWLNQAFFITCAHMFQNLESDEKRKMIDKAKKVRPDASKNLILISFSRYARDLHSSRTRKARLVAIDEESDIAIFQAYIPPNEAEAEAPPSIDLSSLTAFHEGVPQADQKFIPRYPLWLVGYSGSNIKLNQWNTWKTLKDTDIAKKFVSEWAIEGSGEAYAFDYHLWKNREILRRLSEEDQAKWGPVVRELSKKTKDPEFEDLFKENFRALAVGAYVSMTIPQGDPRKEFTAKTRKMLHTISGYHQNSGSMICHFENGDISKPKVIGLFAGEHSTEPYNTCLTFTALGLNWIREIVTSTPVWRP
ncbi:hypothetical protein BDR22DRAFT_864551 [Usnea florida]